MRKQISSTLFPTRTPRDGNDASRQKNAFVVSIKRFPWEAVRQYPSAAIGCKLLRPRWKGQNILNVALSYVSDNFAFFALSTKFSLDLAANTILGQPPGIILEENPKANTLFIDIVIIIS